MQINLADGETLSVREYGQGQPVLVLSGLGMSSVQWLPFLWPFKRNFRFIIPDWRGFGGSKQAKIPRLDAISSHWQDLQQIVQQLHLHHFAVIAYSMGASIAMYGMQYADFSSKISHYLHIDQSPCIKNRTDWHYGLYGKQQTQYLACLSQLRATLQDYTALEYMPRAQQQQLFSTWQTLLAFQGSHPLLLQSLKQLNRFPQLAAYTLPLKSLQMMTWYLDTYLQHDLDLRPSLHTLHCPITWLSGQNSALYPIFGQQLLAQKLKATHVILPKSGHAPLLSQPWQFYQTLRQFLQHIPT